MFRDHLRSHPEDRNTYEKVKRRLAKNDWYTWNEYANAKTECLMNILKKARNL
ncbi:hypothetical protein CYJ36_03570 [Bacillus sp. UMB0893]|nr:hypothetical protein CYJ36_03570 [Bacillus sp. UMB0893]